MWVGRPRVRVRGGRGGRGCRGGHRGRGASPSLLTFSAAALSGGCEPAAASPPAPLCVASIHVQSAEQRPSGPTESAEQRPSGSTESAEQRPSSPTESTEQGPSGSTESAEQRPSGPTDCAEQHPSGHPESAEQSPSGHPESAEQRPSRNTDTAADAGPGSARPLTSVLAPEVPSRRADVCLRGFLPLLRNGGERVALPRGARGACGGRVAGRAFPAASEVCILRSWWNLERPSGFGRKTKS